MVTGREENRREPAGEKPADRATRSVSGREGTPVTDGEETRAADGAEPPATDEEGTQAADGAEPPATDDGGGPESTDKSETSDEADPAVQLAALEARYAQLSDQYMRLAADFDNFRRRTRASEAAQREQAAANLIKDLLPVLDNLQLALEKADAAADDGFAQGVVLIEQQLAAVLQSHGLRPVETVGRPFDPHTMEAVAQMDGQGRAEPGHVLEELRRGYMLYDKVIRPAQVVVAQAP